MILQCPNCQTELSKEANSFSCLKGHHFDVAKEGYVNLLLANQKQTANPGDNAMMINARESFLMEGYYDFIITIIDNYFYDKIEALKRSNEIIEVLDLGSGSGYYTRSLLKAHSSINKTGIDISKIGIAKAAKKDKASNYVVGSINKLPIKTNSVNLALNIFSPLHFLELARVLKQESYLIKVIPGSEHMIEIASLVYDTFRPHPSKLEEELKKHPDFDLLHIEKRNKKIELKKKALIDLITMTPYYYKFSPEKLAALETLTVTFSFTLLFCRYKSKK